MHFTGLLLFNICKYLNYVQNYTLILCTQDTIQVQVKA